MGMIQDIQRLVDQTVELTESAPPDLMHEDAPALEEIALAAPSGQNTYMVGLIGGKDVGKSSMINALVGKEISQLSSYGPGTETAICYVHEDREEEVRKQLDREIPGKYEIITHALQNVRRQVIVDLPDIDSHYESHVDLTRRMLRHILFPVWIQSIEKYADMKPQKLLGQVAEGNAAENFVFCLNKVDYLYEQEGEEAAQEIREDYGDRLAWRLGMEDSPTVWLVSALHPDRYDLPALRKKLLREKSEKSVEASRQKAAQQYGGSLLHWVEGQRFPEQVERLERLHDEAREEIVARIGEPLLQQILPDLMNDPVHRLTLADEMLDQRTASWPIVGGVHQLLKPLTWLIRRRMSLDQQRGMVGPESLVDVHLDGQRQTVSSLIQTTFAHLQQAHPNLVRLYHERKLWEETVAEEEEGILRKDLATTIRHQRSLAGSGVAPMGNRVMGAFRILLTYGALIWFPIIQPILEAWLNINNQLGFVQIFISVLGVAYLYKSAVFLVFYFLGLWLMLKWDTHRKIERMVGRWDAGSRVDPDFNASQVALKWLERLSDPIEDAAERMRELSSEAAELQNRLESALGEDRAA